jgi:ubiquinone/menaquinone biosynthesis C-methylase UbiE
MREVWRWSSPHGDGTGCDPVWDACWVSEARSRGFVELSVPEAYERFMGPQLFEPWARELVARARPRDGMRVLDVASGPGTVAALIAAAVGESGRVAANDISPAMLALAASKPAKPRSAPIEYLACSATALEYPDASFELVACQHGVPFFPERLGALREMHRVLASGGAAVVSTWAAEHPLGLFGAIIDAMRDAELAEPYPRAFDHDSYTLTVSELHGLLETAGFKDVTVETVELDCVWEDSRDAVNTIAGTPFGPLLATLTPERQQRVRSSVGHRLGCTPDGALTVKTASHIARGVK